MSATIYCEAESDKGRKKVTIIDCPAPSRFQKELREFLGYELPITLSCKDYEDLREMAKSWDNPSPFSQIIDILENAESVEIWAEY